MEVVGPIIDVVSRLWKCTAGHAAYIIDLKENLITLRVKMEELRAIRYDVKLKIQVAEQQDGMARSKQVDCWLTKVQDMEDNVNKILHEGEQIVGTCMSVGKCRCQSSYKLGKNTAKMINLVLELIRSRGEFQEMANYEPVLASTLGLNFCELPMEKTLGLDSVLESVLEHLKDDRVVKIGLYGMGGVGKTTLLKRINNELPRSGIDAFDVAIWVVASKQATVEAIQDDVLRKLPIPYEKWRDKPMAEKSALIYGALKVQKYMLMLDDVWEKLDLLEVGIPLLDNQNKGKVIFTTRSKDVCFLMGAHQKIKVACLSWEEAWTLFQEKVGQCFLHSNREIQKLAEMVAKKCGGLPLALVTIGRAMASRETPADWNHALQLLKNNPSAFSGMGDLVLPILKRSCDLLDPIIQECFLYCSIFPEDYEIPSFKLVELWIAKGLVKEFDVSESSNRGFYIIESLKLSCLLESGGAPHFRSVKMHNVIRQMALWIASSCGKKYLILEEKAELMAASDSSMLDWNEVEKLSLWGYMVEEPILTHFCPRLSTLVVNDTYLMKISLGLFQFIPSIRVLDLSGNKFLFQLPREISLLGFLEYLDLSNTALESLPLELRNLTRLRYLLLNYMEKLKECPTYIISGLMNLWVFRMNNGPTYSEEFLRALDSLRNINETSLYVDSSNMLEVFQNQEKLQRCTRFLRLNGVSSQLIEFSPATMNNLEALQIYDSKLRTLDFTNSSFRVFHNLDHAIIYGCNLLENLDCLVYAPSLKNLWVRRCASLQRIIRLDHKNWEKYRVAKNGFSSLKRIRLDELPSLEYICNASLSFPSLERVYVYECPKLLELPFTDIPVKSSLEFIKGDKNWWNSLRWRHSDLQQHFLLYFQHWQARYMKVSQTQELSNVESLTQGILFLSELFVNIGNDEWPEPAISTLYFEYSKERLYILRASMNMWEE